MFHVGFVSTVCNCDCSTFDNTPCAMDMQQHYGIGSMYAMPPPTHLMASADKAQCEHLLLFSLSIVLSFRMYWHNMLPGAVKLVSYMQCIHSVYFHCAVYCSHRMNQASSALNYHIKSTSDLESQTRVTMKKTHQL